MKDIIEELESVIRGDLSEGKVEDEVNDEEEIEEVESDASDNEDDIEEGKGSSKETIKVLADTDYRDKDAFFKMAQLLKGLAAAADEDETAKKFLSKVSDALTTAAKSVLGEEILDEGSKGEYWGRKAKDSKIVKMKEKDAKEVISRKYYSGKGDDVPTDWLMVWWVPSEYKKEAKFRIDGGFLKPVWDWGKGASKIKLTFDSVVSEGKEVEESISWDEELKRIIEGDLTEGKVVYGSGDGVDVELAIGYLNESVAEIKAVKKDLKNEKFNDALNGIADSINLLRNSVSAFGGDKPLVKKAVDAIWTAAKHIGNAAHKEFKVPSRKADVGAAQRSAR